MEVFVKNNKKMTIMILGLLSLSTLSQKLISSYRGDGDYQEYLQDQSKIQELRGQAAGRKIYEDMDRSRFLMRNPLRQEKVDQARVAVKNLLNHTVINKETIKEVLIGLKNYITENEEFENREFRKSVLMSIFNSDDFENDKDRVDLALEILRKLDLSFGEYNTLGKYERLEVLNSL